MGSALEGVVDWEEHAAAVAWREELGCMSVAAAAAAVSFANGGDAPDRPQRMSRRMESNHRVGAEEGEQKLGEEGDMTGDGLVL